MIEKYSKKLNIQHFKTEDIVSIKMPKKIELLLTIDNYLDKY